MIINEIRKLVKALDDPKINPLPKELTIDAVNKFITAIDNLYTRINEKLSQALYQIKPEVSHHTLSNDLVTYTLYFEGPEESTHITVSQPVVYDSKIPQGYMTLLASRQALLQVLSILGATWATPLYQSSSFVEKPVPAAPAYYKKGGGGPSGGGGKDNETTQRYNMLQEIFTWAKTCKYYDLVKDNIHPLLPEGEEKLSKVPYADLKAVYATLQPRVGIVETLYKDHFNELKSFEKYLSSHKVKHVLLLPTEILTRGLNHLQSLKKET